MTAPAATVEPGGTRSERKRAAILEAAAAVFLDTGYAGASMDEIASRSGVSKQTVYKHFASKEALFIAVMNAMMDDADLAVHQAVPSIETPEGLRSYLLEYAGRLLATVLTPDLMQLRRLVIAEAQRFPELAEVLYARGPARALEATRAAFDELAQRRLLRLEDSAIAAAQLNWLILGEPVNRVMMLGDRALPNAAEQSRQAEAAVTTFLAAYCPAYRAPAD